MSNPTPVSDEFAAAMQQLSAEARKSISATLEPLSTTATGVDAPSIERRLQDLEAALSKKIEEMVTTVGSKRSLEVSLQFRKVEEQLDAIRNTETVHQRLFDSLHDELIKYRDNFIHESLQKPFIHDLVHLFDDLSALSAQLRTALHQSKKKSGPLSQWHDNLENSIHALIEVLHRLDVKEIESRDTVDRTLHKVVSYEPADFQEEDGQIVMRLKRGFLWRDQLIRAEEVIAKRFE
ncbi:MAG TPA: nucleotide exchange factor GrpE [Chthoniobacterales bacterium]|nr:nucleotide exchange factor GrpE [Chthoniobacterales bacterium]